MKSFKVIATKDVGYEAIVIAESEEKAFELAKINPDEFNWKRTDDGHDFTIERTIEAKEFPYEEIRDPNGDYFLTLNAAFAKIADRQNLSPADMTGEWKESVLKHIWAVIITDTEEGVHWTFTDPRHYVNREGFIITKETRQHDDEEYNEEVVMETAACS
tara:strand:- start:2049 stop:2528 length:480 start_codon:yes stop_codon:yes gene_type:complete